MCFFLIAATALPDVQYVHTLTQGLEFSASGHRRRRTHSWIALGHTVLLKCSWTAHESNREGGEWYSFAAHSCKNAFAAVLSLHSTMNYVLYFGFDMWMSASAQSMFSLPNILLISGVSGQVLMQRLRILFLTYLLCFVWQSVGEDIL